jgi:glyoxylate/hydroxypyruvate reductase A
VALPARFLYDKKSGDFSAIMETPVQDKDTPMTMLFLAPRLRGESWLKHIRREDPGIDLQIWPEVGRAEDVIFALCWKHPLGELKKYPNLKCIASLGFGVDHILRDPDLPADVPVTRLVDAGMITAMSEYVLTAVLMYVRQFDLYRLDQAQKKWTARIAKQPHAVRVGIMGLGHLGADAAAKLRALGFAVSGWSRTMHQTEGVQCFAGDSELGAFLAQTQILICLLPLTPATEKILNRETFSQLPRGAYIINAARGDHLVEEDLLAALETGHLSGACLDVFRTEPLPGSHPFWSHPRVTVTPHVASLTYPKAVAPQIVENYRRVCSGKPPLHGVDIQRGY